MNFFTAFVVKGEEWILHSMSFILGVLLFYVIYGQTFVIYSFLLTINTWTALQIAKKNRYRSYRMITLNLCTIFIFGSLFTFLKSQNPCQRIFQISILSMKIYSIALGMEKDRRRKLPDMGEYLGYLFCPCITNYCILTTFNEYQTFCSRKVRFFWMNLNIFENSFVRCHLWAITITLKHFSVLESLWSVDFVQDKYCLFDPTRNHFYNC